MLAFTEFFVVHIIVLLILLKADNARLTLSVMLFVLPGISVLLFTLMSGNAAPSEAGAYLAVFVLMLALLPADLFLIAAHTLKDLHKQNIKLYAADVKEISSNSDKQQSKVPVRTDVKVSFTWNDETENRQIEDYLYFKNMKKEEKAGRGGKVDIAVGHPKEYPDGTPRSNYVLTHRSVYTAKLVSSAAGMVITFPLSVFCVWSIIKTAVAEQPMLMEAAGTILIIVLFFIANDPKMFIKNSKKIKLRKR